MPVFYTGNVTEINCWLSFKKPRQLKYWYVFVGLTSWVLESTWLCPKKSLLRTLENIVAHTSWWKVILLLFIPLTDNPRKLQLLRSLDQLLLQAHSGSKVKKETNYKTIFNTTFVFFFFFKSYIIQNTKENVYSFLQKGSIYPLLCSYFFCFNAF